MVEIQNAILKGTINSTIIWKLVAKLSNIIIDETVKWINENTQKMVEVFKTINFTTNLFFQYVNLRIIDIMNQVGTSIGILE